MLSVTGKFRGVQQKNGVDNQTGRPYTTYKIVVEGDNFQMMYIKCPPELLVNYQSKQKEGDKVTIPVKANAFNNNVYFAVADVF